MSSRATHPAGVGHYELMPQPPPSEPGKPRGLIWILVGTAVAAGTASAVAVLAIDRPHRWGAGVWLSDFAKSPGMAGLFALIAALVALGGILHQVTQARKALRHQQVVEEDRAWWTRFEWAAGRAVPADPSDDPLPWAAVLSTFEALASNARDEVQQTAVGAIMDVAAKNSTPRTEDNESDPASPPTEASHALSALRTYVGTTADTPAQSTAVQALLYEAEVMDALARHFPDNVVVRTGVDISDALLDFEGRRIAVELKAYAATPGRESTFRLERQLRHYMEGSQSVGGLLVAPVEIRLSQQAKEEGIGAVRWRSTADDENLARAVMTLASRQR